MKPLTAPLQPAPECKGCPIRHRAVCAMSSEDELVLLDAAKSYRTYAPGEEIFGMGEPMPFVATVVAGHVALRRTLPDGRRQMVGLLFPSDFLGRPHREQAAYEAQALGEVTLCRFDRKIFEELLSRAPNLETRLLQMTLDEMDATREWLLLLGRKSAGERIASFLAMVAERAGALTGTQPAEARPVALPLSREDIAEYLGLTIETVSRQFSKLRREGVIRLADSRTVVIEDYGRLAELSGDD